MKKKVLIILGLIVLLVVIVFTTLIVNKKVKLEEEQEQEDEVGQIYNDKENFAYDLEREITTITNDIVIQGLVEGKSEKSINMSGGQLFEEFVYDIEEYTTANIEIKNQTCIDYLTSEKYDINYIESGDLLICRGDLIKYSNAPIKYIDTKNNEIVVLKREDFNKMQEQTINSDNPIITIGAMYLTNNNTDGVTSSTESYLYIKYDIEDNTNSDTVHHFPFVRKVYITDRTEIIGKLEKGKKIKVQYDYSDDVYNNAKYVDLRLKLKSIEVIEQ